MREKEIKYFLFDKNQEMVNAWKGFFGEQSDVEIILGDFNSIKCDTIVSPANSFGFMDGGIDYAISDRLGWGLQIKLQQIIKDLPEGELLVGQALILDTEDKDIPYLISAPTMRIPTNFNIATSINAYLAIKATLIKVKSHHKMNRIAIPGFCTGTGRMNKLIAAKQMFMAYKEIVSGERMDFKEFGEAQKYHFGLNPEGMIWIH
ncbi:macro domain-containing protein [Sporocytophaga myxococcoides]|uniref:macro domain-containing protein n=1 Tax=Sporocytophaga myxococcoides TaxID=153721 RepID=UPI0004254FAE|nr:macro domain-containing protein [Sporocytophaga myxococcoides]